MFLWCESLSSISLESNWRLTRIESTTFSDSSFQWIEIPQGVQFIDSSALFCVSVNYLSIEAGHDRFVVEQELLIDSMDHGLIHNLLTLSHIEILG
jgi:hypothetical protein